MKGSFGRCRFVLQKALAELASDKDAKKEEELQQSCLRALGFLLYESALSSINPT